MTRRDSTLCFSSIVLLLLVGIFVLSSPSLAQDPIPTAADPSSAEQETLDLEVTVTGDNFGKDSVVEFLVTGTENPGGIKVKKVKSLGPQKLKVTVDVEADAVVDDFDIRVMSRGRTGKGTELFRVLEKEHPNQDTTPPGVVDVSVVQEGVTYNKVELTWFAPADDGHDPGSGPVDRLFVACGLVDCPQGDCDEGGCQCSSRPGTHSPGEEENCIVYRNRSTSLLPDTEYWFQVRYRDDSENYAEWSDPVHAVTEPLVIAPSWRVQEVASPGSPFALTRTLGHGFDPNSGEPVIAGVFEDLYRVARGTWNDALDQWDWAVDSLSGPIKFTGTWRPVGFALDPISGTAAFAASTKPKGNQLKVLYTYYDGADWVHETVESPRGTFLSVVSMTFDPDGNPVLAYNYRHSRSEELQLRLARRNPGGQWDIDVVDPTAGMVVRGMTFDDSGELVIIYHVKVSEDPPRELVKVVREAEQGWQVETFTPPGPPDKGTGYFQLIWDPVRADLVAVMTKDEHLWYCERVSGNWLCEEMFFAEPSHFWWMAIDSYGEVFVAYSTWTEDVNLAHRGLASTEWSHEIVDNAWVHFEHGNNVSWSLTHLALDPIGSPTLTWRWNQDIDLTSVDFHTYFAWKTTP